MADSTSSSMRTGRARTPILFGLLFLVGLVAASPTFLSFGSGENYKLNGPLVVDFFGDIRQFDITADGGRVVYLADQDEIGRTELYSVPIDGREAPTKLSAPDPSIIGISWFPGFELSPDGSRAVYLGLHDPFQQELYSVPVDGSADPIRLNGSLVAGGNVWEIGISADGGQVVYVADQEVDDLLEGLPQ